MMNSNLNLSALPECKFSYQMVNSALLIPCAEYQRVLHVEKVAHIAENFSEYVANEPKVSFRNGRFYVFDGQNTVEARRTCNGGKAAKSSTVLPKKTKQRCLRFRRAMLPA